MELKSAFQKVMETSVNMALATSVDNQPNVRVVTFGHDDAQPGKLFFSTFQGNKKIEEFAKNPLVACMPLPLGPEADSQVRIFGKVQRSTLSLEALIGIISKKADGDAETLKQGGEMLEIYEVAFSEAWVTMGMNDAQRYEVGK